jgi:hypothetical protein
MFQQQSPSEVNRTGAGGGGISEVQSRLDGILKRKEQRERAAAAGGGARGFL